MSMYTDALRDIAANHGWPVCDEVADELEDHEKAYGLLFAENGKLRDEIERLRKDAERYARALIDVMDGLPDHHIKDETALPDEDCERIAKARADALLLLTPNPEAKPARPVNHD